LLRSHQRIFSEIASSAAELLHERPRSGCAAGSNGMTVHRHDDALRSIGIVRSPLRDVRDAPMQASEGAPGALVEIDPRFEPALHGVAPGMDLMLVTWLHRADRAVLQVHPRGDETLPLTGVFATRSPDRPNPIGLHRVTVLGVDPPSTLRVRALEAIDGTPVFDLKAVLDESRDG
jgi:tRNA-Thr(GGU) m(6)t(6)A37 methyltransferase TsaA